MPYAVHYLEQQVLHAAQPGLNSLQLNFHAAQPGLNSLQLNNYLGNNEGQVLILLSHYTRCFAASLAIRFLPRTKSAGELNFAIR